VFAHRDELDFSSLLDENHVIPLPDNDILGILHAHTRASVIINFCLPHTFTLFTDLDQYLSLYWSKYSNDGTEVIGHPMGTLQQIYYVNCWGLPYNASSESKELLLSLWKKYEPYSEVLNYIDSYGRPGKPWPNTSLYNNWSSANIEIPYHCTTCNSLIPCENDTCDECSPCHF
jgi:hypothetical protein